MDGNRKKSWGEMNICDVERYAQERGERLRERIANRTFLKRMRPRRVPTRNPQGLNKPPNERG